MDIKIETEHEKNARVFKALCDEKRLAVLALLRGGEKCACVLTQQMDIGQSALSYHMKILCESGIVTSRQDGKWTHYRLSEDGASYAKNLLVRLTTPNVWQEEDVCVGACAQGAKAASK